MFNRSVYEARRAALRRSLDGGVIVFPGNPDASMNFAGNSYPFVQDGSFSYFFGVLKPDLIGVIDIESGDDFLIGDDPSEEGVIWNGTSPRLSEHAWNVGVRRTLHLGAFTNRLRAERQRGRWVHYLPQYRPDILVRMSEWLEIDYQALNAGASIALIRAVVALREIKDPEEVREMEAALAVTSEMHMVAMAASRPGVMEYQVVGEMEGIARRHGWDVAYRSIFTRRGEILHCETHGCRLEKGDLVVNDAGTSSGLGYASDISRTLPIGGRFNEQQKPIYEVVLAAQAAGIAALKPGACFLDVHKRSMCIMVEALSDLGLFRGDPEEIVESGAYALVFPAGLGHQIGLDVHDMESLGEDFVGYDAQVIRSNLFGLKSLRLGKKLLPGMVITVEPGIYFIPKLIERWEAHRMFDGMINYAAFRSYSSFRGARVEDEVLVTRSGARVLGPTIPKEVADVERAMGV